MAPTPWRTFWEAVDAANDRFWNAVARAHGQYLCDLRVAMQDYGWAVDADSFDKLGQAIEDKGVA